MKIPSLQKIEQQVDAWLKENFHVPELEAQIKEAEDQVRILRVPWFKEREHFCNGDPCICSSHPKYETLVTEALQPAARKVDDLYTQWRRLRSDARAAKHRELLLGRAAKLKYSKTP